MTDTVTKHCSLCNDTGWKIVVKDGREFAQKCDCQARDNYLTKGKNINIPKRFLTVNLDNYYPDKKYPSQTKAKEIVQKFISDYPSGSKGILLQGSVGVGKTKLLCIIGLELMKKFGNKVDIYYVDWGELVREMRYGDHIANRDFSYINKLIFKLADVDILLFDELGSATATTWVLDNIYYIFNKRYNEQKTTLCATNYWDESINEQEETLEKRVGKLIRSRLYEMTQIVRITGEDLRKHSKKD